MVVMDAVDDEVKPAADRMIRLPVEYEAVKPVLGERPDQETEREEADQGGRAVAPVGAQPDPGDDNGHEDDCRHRGMDPREIVEEPVLE